MGKTLRLACVAVGALGVVAVLGFTTKSLASYPPTVAASITAPGEANLRIQTVGAIGSGDHPTWVSYLVQDSHGSWVHSTIWQLPAHSLIHVTVEQYDTAGPLRNELWGEVTGTPSGTIAVNSKPLALSDANGQDSTTAPAHTFTVSELGLNVPLVGTASDVKNACSDPAPCDPSKAHVTIAFDFRTGVPGKFRWQCFVPCGLSYLDGNGGPMQQLGYMGGFLNVVNA